MAKTNYSFEKRQRELDKKRKAEEKRLRKLDGKGAADAPGEGEDAGSDAAAPQPGSENLPVSDD